MNIDEIRQEIEKLTGVPASLLNGETTEENIAQAKALLAYKREAETDRPKSIKEQFIDWLNADQETEAQTQTEERAKGQKNRIARQQFEEWAGQALAFDPFKNGGGW